MKRIPLTQGKFVLVSNKDYTYLMQWKWFAHKNRITFYAERNLSKTKPCRLCGCRKFVTLRMHQAIAERMHLNIKDKKVDHKDRNGLNNQRSNLRIATDSQSNSNQGKRKNNTSGYTGVTEDKRRNKWVANIRVKGKQSFLGIFTNKKDAARAYNEAAIKCRGPFAVLNKI